MNFSKIYRQSQVLFRSAVFIVMLAHLPFASSALACDYYASPSGTGTGLSQSSPFKISNFWSSASSGKTLCLLNGTYRGSTSMIDPPDNLNGTSSNPITVKALNDGKATINGEGSRRPVTLIYNDYFILEGFNAHSSNSSVVHIWNSDNNIVRRVVAWDAKDDNTNVFGVHSNNNTLLEDVAAFGVARKIFSGSQGGDNLTCRRCWGMWERSTEVGPKMTMAPVYNTTGVTIENSIFTWKSKISSINQPFGILSVDRIDGSDRRAFLKIFGSIFYVMGSDVLQPGQQLLITKIDEVEIKDTVSYFAGGANSTKKTFDLSHCMTAHIGGSPCSNANLRATNLTSIGGAGHFISSHWQKTNVKSGSNIDAVYPSGQSLFDNDGNRGATICKRYKKGSLTNLPLWPWPMNQRIIDAMNAAGKQPINVTNTIEQILGVIPSQCKGSGTDNDAPNAPTNLRVAR